MQGTVSSLVEARPVMESMPASPTYTSRNNEQLELLSKGNALYHRILVLEEKGRGSGVNKTSLMRAHGGDFHLMQKIDKDGDECLTFPEWKIFLQNEINTRNQNSPKKGIHWLRSLIYTFETNLKEIDETKAAADKTAANANTAADKKAAEDKAEADKAAADKKEAAGDKASANSQVVGCKAAAKTAEDNPEANNHTTKQPYNPTIQPYNHAVIEIG